MASGQYNQVQVRLFRDSLSTPWGFRLQGGQDFNQPLAIQRVFVGSPAEGELHRGDIVLVLEDYDASQLTHKEAQETVKKAGGQLSLWIYRGSQKGVPQVPTTPTLKSPPTVFSPTRPGPATSVFSPTQSKPAAPLFPKPKPKVQIKSSVNMSSDPKSPTAKFGVRIPSFKPSGKALGTDFRHVPPGRQLSNEHEMMTKVNESLSNIVLQPSQAYQPQVYSSPRQQLPQQQITPATSMDDVDDYELASVRERKQMFQQRTPQAQSLRKSGKRVTINTNPKYELGWSPGQGAAPPKPNRWVPANYNPSTDEVVSEQTQGPSAWEGSLRPAANTKPWDVTNDGFGPAIRSDNRKPSPWVPPKPKPAPKKKIAISGQGMSPDGARVVHLQYNTPLQMYGKETAEDTLVAQTQGQPGAGTLKISGGQQPQIDIKESPTYKFLHYSEKQSQKPHSTRYEELVSYEEAPRYKGYIDENRQSLAFKSIQKLTDTEGVSDF